MSGSIKSKENFWLLSFWRLMSRVNNVQENIISGEIKPRRIKSKGNFCPGGKFWRKTYPEEKIRGKDGAKPYLYLFLDTNDNCKGSLITRPKLKRNDVR